jgi:circadian clock protein KaiB
MSQPHPHVFRLYVAGQSMHSMRALENLRSLCREFVPDAHVIETVDVLREPLRALKEGVIVTPTLLRLEPAPLVRIIGNLGDRPTVVAALGWETFSS